MLDSFFSPTTFAMYYSHENGLKNKRLIDDRMYFPQIISITAFTFPLSIDP